MVAGDITSTIPFTVPEIVPAVKGALRDTGLQVVTCDTKGTPGGAQACEHQAVADGVVAVINGFSQMNADQAILTKANIALLGQTDDTSPTSFDINSLYGGYVSLGLGIAKTGCDKLGILYLDGTDLLVDNVKNGFEAQGGKEVARAAVASNAPDLTPAVAKITGAGAQCVALSLTPTQVAQAITAIKQSGKSLIMGGVAGIFTPQVRKSLGSLVEGVVTVTTTEDPSDNGPGLDQYRADIKAVDSGAQPASVGVLVWAAAKLVAAALPKIEGPVTATTMLAALNGLRDVDLGGVIPNWSSVELDNPAYKRWFNHYGVTYKIHDGNLVRQGDFYDLAPVLDAK